MSELQYTEKFIAFFDVLGWKYLVRASEEGRVLSLRELSEILAALGTAGQNHLHFQIGDLCGLGTERSRSHA